MSTRPLSYLIITTYPPLRVLHYPDSASLPLRTTILAFLCMSNYFFYQGDKTARLAVELFPTKADNHSTPLMMEGEMVEELELRKTKERSPIFPFISLEQAIERARQFFAEEKRGSAPLPAVAKHWNYSQSSSGLVQTVSALKNYGLFSEEGSGSTKKFRLTELALRILLDTRPDDTERLQYMKQAALTPNIAAEIHEKWDGELPSDATLNHFLVLELGFSTQTSQKTLNIIKKNHELILSADSSMLPSKEVNYDNTAKAITSTDEKIMDTPTPSTTENEVIKQLKGRTERVIDPDGLDVVIQFSDEPTIASYEFIKDYVELRIKALERSSKVRNSNRTNDTNEEN